MAKARRKPEAAKQYPHDRAVELFRRLAFDRPDPSTELDFKDPFTLLVAVALSAQATDVGVNRATKGLFAVADTPARMVELGEAGVAAHIRTIGLWRNKARNVVALSRIILERHGGATPRTREDLEALPGVGRKTASVVLSEAYGETTIAVDTHVFRVANRTGLASGPTPEKVEALLMEVTPENYRRGAHHWLILHGRYVCLARKPGCQECSIRNLCDYPDKTPTLNSSTPERKDSTGRAAGRSRGAGQAP
ncbi:MAG: endonuclease III [Alphaproteobacteria bacterium]|nr:endonuclease III [Alphaproteobacteria bacterium]